MWYLAELEVRINSSAQNCQNLCSKWAPRTRTQVLIDDDVTENVKPHL